jgi:putative iron-regulated protein
MTILFKQTVRKFVAAAFLVGGLVACQKDESISPEQLEKQVIENYANIVYASYEDTYKAAVLLQQAVDNFVKTPTAQGLESCQTAWKNTRIPYSQTEAYRFYGGFIDGQDGVEGYINAWPIDENFVDYVAGNPSAGFINNPTLYPTINKDALLQLNESISETSIFTGFHTIEFLLWGQDLSTTSAGTRPYTDYVTGGTAQNQARRGEYLKVVTALLVEHLALVKDAWQIGGSYRTTFVGEKNTKATLGKIFTGLGELSKGEMAGERMKVALETQDQEQEQDCFSDYTTNDIVSDFVGLRNVYTGTYTRTDGTVIKGTSLADLVGKADAKKNQAVLTALSSTEAQLKKNSFAF